MEQAQSDFPRRTAYWFYLVLLLGGVAFYLGWSLYWGTWNLFDRQNVGVYAITVLMMGFGVTGLLLYGRKRQ
ncbi:MAG TPA: hypothetical protein VJ397_08430 [Thermoplasmata archaeon]|nr:hypothetical protein [Thermoplasmata archaeon]